MTTSAELSEAWNTLRNATLGRGTQPLVSAALADRIAADWDGWRAFYETSGPLQFGNDANGPTVIDVLSGMALEAAPSAVAWRWVETYRDDYAAARAELGDKAPAPLPGTPIEKARKIVEDAGSILEGFVIAAMGITLAGLAFKVFGSRRRG